MPKWLGFVVVARKPNKKAYKEVSKPYATKSAAEDFLALYAKSHPSETVYVSEKVQRDSKRGELF